MITDITIQNIATYIQPAPMTDLRRINFVFGANGTGKTTISRAIEQAEGHSHCSLLWLGGLKLDVMVYNQDFVERNFNQESAVRGVFTLGDNQVDAEREIARIQPEIDRLTDKIRSLNVQLNGDDSQQGKITELKNLEPELRVKCWRQKQLHDEYFQEAFAQAKVRGDGDKFKEKVLAERETNQADLFPLEELKEKASTIFSKTLERTYPVPVFDVENLTAAESNVILQKIIVGNQDVDIAALINQLGNSDWVKQGLHYHAQDQLVCPFCQQPTNEKFSNSLTAFFSESYDKEVHLASNLLNNYQADSAQIMEVIKRIYESNNPFIKMDLFVAEVQAFSERIERNKSQLQEKVSEPSRKVTLEPVQPLATKVLNVIKNANEVTELHNQKVQNIVLEKKTLTAQVWRYILNELEGDLNQYDQKKIQLELQIQGLQNSRRDKQQKIHNLQTEVKELEKQSTSTLPTRDTINGLLQTFGFTSFHIDVVDDHGHYKICRQNGDDASRSLSEGEKTFITFLYFYSLIKGAHSSSGTTANRVVVFDDPISSLDSDVLYIVSSLIKGVFDEVRSGSNIKQIFVLTHNVYFHKEISYNSSRPNNQTLNEESFWMVKKLPHGSIVERHTENPIRSAYELLWEDVKSQNASCLTIQNTLRRILENYFKMWGGKNKDEICALFDGRDKLICQSLFSWINDGSHSIHDDLYVNHGEQSNEAFLRIFKEIFIRADQIGHYNMMAGETA